MMGSPSPVASKVRKESPSSSSSSKVRPHRRTSSVASSCVSLELGDQDVQSPGRSSGLGKSPVATSSSPQTPGMLEKSGSPAALKKRRASIGGPDDLARGLDFGSSSPSTEEKKHPFLTRGGGHKKVAAPAMQSSSPVKKATTPPGKEKLVTGRATASTGLSPKKLGEAKKDTTSPRRSVLASESSSMNESLVSEVTSGLVAKRISPRASLDSKISAMKSSPRSNTTKPVASKKGRTNSNGEVPVEGLDADTKSSPGKSPDVKIRKSSPLSPLKFKPGWTSPKSLKLAKTRQGSPSLPGRVKTGVEKAVSSEDLHTPELGSVEVSSEYAMEAISGDVSAKREEEGLTLLPSLMLVDGNVGDEDMSSLDQGGGDPGFDTDMEMPTSWLSEDLPCMFSSLSRLPEPDDSSSSILGDPPEVLIDDPLAEDATIGSPELADPSHFKPAADIVLKSTVTLKSPSEISKEVLEGSDEAEDELEPQRSEQTLLFPAVVVPQSVPLKEKSAVVAPPVTESAVHEDSLQVSEAPLTNKQSSQVEFESRGTQPGFSKTVEVPRGAKTKEILESSKLLDLNVPTAILALREEGTHPGIEDEIPGVEIQHMIASSDDESSEDFSTEHSCGLQLNLKQSFDAAAEPAVSHNDVDEGECDMLSMEDTCNLASALSTNAETLPHKAELVESLDGEERGRFTPTEVDQDMMIFDFEEYWTRNAGDESFPSDASQNGADELQSWETREALLRTPDEDEVAKSLPANFTASNSCQTDTKSAHHEEFEEEFHLFEGSEQVNLKAETNVSSPSKPTFHHNLKPLAPIPSGESDSSESLPSYTTLATEHFNAVRIDQVDQNVDMLNEKAVEVEVTEDQNPAVHTLLVQDSSVADLPVSKSDLPLSNNKAPVAERASAHEELDIPPVSAATSNGLPSIKVQPFEVNPHAVFEGPNPSPVTMQVASHKSSFETPAQPEALVTDGPVDMISEYSSVPEVCATAETTDDRIAAETESQNSPNRDVTRAAVGSDDLSYSEVNSLKLLTVESDWNTLNSCADDEVDPLGLSSLTNGISEEEQTEAAFLLSLESREESDFSEDSSITEQKLQTKLSHDEPQGRADIIEVNDPACLAGDERIKAKFLIMSSEEEEEEIEAPDHSNLQILSRGMFPVEERPVESQYQEDERTTQRALQMETSRDTPNVSEVHHQPEVPLKNTLETLLINTPETLVEDKEAQAHVPTEKGLPKEVQDESHILMSVSCSPVFDKEDEAINENFDSKYKVELTPSLDEVDMGTGTVIPAAGAAVNDATSSAEILGKGEAICNTNGVTPVSLSAGEYSNLGCHEVGDFDGKLGSEDTVDEERRENVGDLGEQSSIAVHVLEEPLPVVSSDSNSSPEDPMDTLLEEPTVSSTTSSAVVDDTTKDIQIHSGKPEEALMRTTSISDESHDLTFQESQIPLEAPVPTNDQVSKTEVILETEEVLMTPAFDGSDDVTVKGVETVPENIISQDLRFVACHQPIFNDARSDVEENEHAGLTGVKEKEEENISETLVPIPVFMKRNSVEDNGRSMDVDEREGTSAAQVTPPSEVLTSDTLTPENTPTPDQHSADETLLEDEETVDFSPIKIFVASGTPDTTVKGAAGVEAGSPVSWTASKEVESFSGNCEEESMLDSALVHSPKDKVDIGAQKNPITTDNGTHTADENGEGIFLHEKPLLQDEGSPKEFIVVSEDDTAISDVDDMEEHSSKGGKEEKESLHGSLERDEVSPVSKFNIPPEFETPTSEISEVNHVQNHSNNACSGESFHGRVKEESVLEGEDTVVCRPAVDDFSMERTSSSKVVETVMDSHMEIFNALEDTELRSPVVEEPLMEGSVPEGVEKVVDSHKEMLDVPDQDTTNKASLIVEEQETPRNDMEGETLNGSIESECQPEVGESTNESFIAPDLLKSNLVAADELEKQTVQEEILDQSPEEKSTFGVAETMAESSEEEPSVARDTQNATNASNLGVADELEKQTGKEKKTLEQFPEKRSSIEVEETMAESSEEEPFVSRDTQNATNTSNLGVADELEKQTGKEKKTLEQFSEKRSSIEVEETMAESSEEEPFVARDTQNATNTSNLGVADELEKQTGKEEKTLEQFPEKRSSIEVEEIMAESSEEEPFVSRDTQNATNTSNLGVADELEKQTGKEEKTLEQSPEEKSTSDVEETMAESSEEKPFVSGDTQNAINISNLGVADELEKQTGKEEKTLEQSPEEKSTSDVEETMTESSEEEPSVARDTQNATNASNLGVADEMEVKILEQIPEKRSSFEVKETVVVESSEKESLLAPDLPTNTSSLDVADELEKQTDKEDETLDESLDEMVVHNNTQQACVASDLQNEKTSKMVVDQTDKEEETLKEKPVLEVEETVVETSKASVVVSDALPETSDAEDLDKHSTWKTSNKEEGSLNGSATAEEAIQDTVVVSSNENVKKESVSLSEDATQKPREIGGQTADVVKNSSDETEVAKTDTYAEDFNKSNETSAVENGEKSNDLNAPGHDTANMRGTTASTNTQPDTTSEPQSPTATTYPLSKLPFSGSRQDRLWEEQAEAYNSGQGTPSRNEGHAIKVGASCESPSPREKPASSEDQIQPVAAAANGNHAVVAGPSNGAGSHENGNALVVVQPKGNGKEKLHTPLRSLLLEDVTHRDSILTPNGISSNPSFIRRLFRVLSTSSRGSDREVPQAKLKRSSSMWVNCLGAPQVQQ